MSASLIKKILALLVAALVVLILAFGASKLFGPNSGTTPVIETAQGDTPVMKSGFIKANALPEGLPIENSNLLKDGTYSVLFPESRQMAQYTVSYWSDSSRKDKFNEYLEYMEKAGFDLGQNGKDTRSMSLYGIKDNDDLSVTISTLRDKTLVQITYLERQ